VFRRQGRVSARACERAGILEAARAGLGGERGVTDLRFPGTSTRSTLHWSGDEMRLWPALTKVGAAELSYQEGIGVGMTVGQNVISGGVASVE
jgi:hypothetical protein